LTAATAGGTVKKAKSRASREVGFRTPRTASEQRFWDLHRPNLKEWALKEKATKAWFQHHKKEFRGGFSLEGILVVGTDMGINSLPLPPEFERIVDLKQAKYLDADAEFARLGRKIKELEEHNSALSKLLAKNAVTVPVKINKTAISRIDQTDAKIIVALIFSQFKPEERSREFLKLKNGENNHVVKKITVVLWKEFGWAIAEDTVYRRVRAVVEAYEVDQRGKLTRG
jgi:phosphopantetheinyl transferase (holo-ACP synthase)